MNIAVLALSARDSKVKLSALQAELLDQYEADKAYCMAMHPDSEMDAAALLECLGNARAMGIDPFKVAAAS